MYLHFLKKGANGSFRFAAAVVNACLHPPLSLSSAYLLLSPTQHIVKTNKLSAGKKVPNSKKLRRKVNVKNNKKMMLHVARKTIMPSNKIQKKFHKLCSVGAHLSRMFREYETA